MKLFNSPLVHVFIRVVYAVIILFLLSIFLPIFQPGTRSRHIDQQKHFEELFEGGDTNAPSLAMDWFGDYGVYFCRVSQSGKIFAARDVGHAIQAGHRTTLDITNRQSLIAAMNDLPSKAKRFLPKGRQILISGIRSNQWFKCIYDRANIPVEVEKLCEITGAYLEWYIPHVGSSPQGVAHAMSQNSPNSFAIAQEASYGVSVGNQLQIWDLNRSRPAIVFGSEKLPLPWRGSAYYIWSVAAISPDGRIIIVAARDSVMAFDWQHQKVLWQRDQIALGNTYQANNRTLAVGNRGDSLYIAEANSVERWKIDDGTFLANLTTNNTGVKILQPSWNGEFLLTGFGDNSFGIWKTDKSEPIFQFKEPAGANSAAISPDGQRVVLNSFRQRKLIVYDWKQGKRSEFPLRSPYASGSAYSLCWSPDGSRLVADIDTYPSSAIIYETETWKPIANWPCGAIGSGSIFLFNKDGRLFQLIDGIVNSLDVSTIESIFP